MCRLRENVIELTDPIREPVDAPLRHFTASQIARRMFDADYNHEDRVNSAVNQAIHSQHYCHVI